MARLADFMPKVEISAADLKPWGDKWLVAGNLQTGKEKKEKCFDRHQSVNFASFIDEAFAKALSLMLGGIPVEKPNHASLLPPQPDCVEVGPTRIVGGIRPQNFDAAYRPDGPRIVFDSKTLNDLKSVGKNWQNMVNDLATEASTVHIRFPYAIVAFMVIIPAPALGKKQAMDIVRTLERLASRQEVLDQPHLAEALALVIWDPVTGVIDENIPNKASNLRLEKFSDNIYPHYINRYKGLPPHDEDHKEDPLKEYE
jgi:hypothetical protein